MKRFLTILFVFSIIAFAFGSEARMYGFLGNFWQIDDAHNFVYMPNTIVNYNNMVLIDYIERGSKGGVIWKMNSNMYLGLYFPRGYDNAVNDMFDYEPYSSDTQGFNFTLNMIDGQLIDPNLELVNLFNLAYALKLNNNFTVGTLITYSVGKRSYNVDQLHSPLQNGDQKNNYEKKGSEFKFTFNITLKEFSFFNLIDINLTFGLPNYNFDYIIDQYDGSNWKNSRNLNIKMDGANEVNLWTNLRTKYLGMFIALNMEKLDHTRKDDTDANLDGTLDTSTGEEVNQKVNYFVISFYKNIRAEKYLWFAHVTYTNEKDTWDSKEYDYLANDVTNEYNYEAKISNISVGVGIEYYLKKWLTLRTGGSYTHVINDEDDINNPDYAGGSVSTIGNSTSSTKSDYISYTMGTSFSFKSFTLDLLINPTDLFNRLYILTGRTGRIIGSASLSYKF